MSDPISRNQFLRGDLRGSKLPVRPPWSAVETLFLERCSRCDDCIAACGQRILKRGAGGFPQVYFAYGHCTFCGECVKACSTGALSFPQDSSRPPWILSIEFTDNCLALQAVVCRVCGERCEESAIRFQLQTGGKACPLVVADLCNGCGECVSICPNQAVHIQPTHRVKAA